MFKRLRNKLIIINLGITSLVIVTVFAAIYMFSINSAKQRPPMPDSKIELYSDDVESVVRISIENEKQSAAQDLLVLLVVSGVAIEFVVAIISYFLAEIAIRPVREAYDTQKVFIANASHEIKTPLAAISANLEAADIRGNKWIANVEKETAKLTTLNNELLTLARTDLTTKITVKEVDLAQLVEETLKSFEPRLNGIKLSKNIAMFGKLKINATDFKQILEILTDNAIKYCNKKISLDLSGHELKITNDGTTISEKDLPYVFERFYQTDKTSEGVGLGLSIAKSAAERNGWFLMAESGEKFTRFILKY